MEKEVNIIIWLVLDVLERVCFYLHYNTFVKGNESCLKIWQSIAQIGLGRNILYYGLI